MDQLSSFSPDLKDSDEIMFIYGKKDDKLRITFFDGRFCLHHSYIEVNVPIGEISEFLDSHCCRNLKGAVFYIVDFDNDYKLIDLKIRQMVHDEFKKRNLSIHFADFSNVRNSSILALANFESKQGDITLIIEMKNYTKKLYISELFCMEEGYLECGSRRVYYFNESFEEMKTEILGTSDPKFVIIYDCDSDPVDRVFLAAIKSFVSTPQNVVSVNFEYARDKDYVKTFFDPNRRKFHVIPLHRDDLVVTTSPNFDDSEKDMIFSNTYKEILPFRKSQIVSKSCTPFYIKYFIAKPETYEIIKKVEHENGGKGHRIMLSLFVDANSIPFLYQEPFIIPEIQKFYETFSSTTNLKIPVITFFDNSSIICVYNKIKYDFLKSWNGLYGKELYLSFKLEKPAIIANMKNVKDNNNSYIIYDLIKILSKPANDIKNDPNWGFYFIRDDSNNSLFLDFDTYKGRRKATPFYLMTLLLKLHIIKIENEIGEKVKELGFYLFDKFSPEECRRIENGLQEACKQLKINYVSVKF